MQKIWRQIGFSWTQLSELHEFMVENQCRNETEAIANLMKQHKLFRRIVKDLEKKAHETEEWKARAQAHIKEGKNEAKTGEREKNKNPAVLSKA